MCHVDTYTRSNARNGMFENISLARCCFKKSIFNPLLDVFFCRRVYGFPFYQYFIHFKHIHNLNNSDTSSRLKEASPRNFTLPVKPKCVSTLVCWPLLPPHPTIFLQHGQHGIWPPTACCYDRQQSSEDRRTCFFSLLIST